MWKTQDGSTGRLGQLCIGYFISYTFTGVAVKYFTGKADQGFPGMNGVEYLVYNTLGSMAVVLGVVLLQRWYRMKSNRPMKWGRLRFPSEMLYIVPSGICTAVVIPTTTLMYTLPISVMVAMVIMRGSIIVVSRLVDALQIRQGLLHRRVYWQEEIAVAFALLAVGTKIFWTPGVVNPAVDALKKVGIGAAEQLRLTAASGSNFEFLHSSAAMWILSSYLVAYAIRIYIMNYYKNTRPAGEQLNNRAFFAIEQLAATVVVLIVAVFLATMRQRDGSEVKQLAEFQNTFLHPHAGWAWAAVAGIPYGILAFFSVFIFMFKGRTATFAGLVNRLTSLIAGTASTLYFAFVYKGRYPSADDWLSLVFILTAVGFLSSAERRRRAELQRNGTSRA